MNIRRSILYIVSLLLCSNHLVSQDLNNGLLINYNFNGDYLDTSLNEFNGTPFQTVFAEDRNGLNNSAIELSGDAFVEFPNEQTLKPQFPLSIALWIKPEIQTITAQGIFGNDQTENNYYGVFVSLLKSGKILTGYGDGCGDTSPECRQGYVTQNTLESGIWYHVAVNFIDAQTIDIFINGCKVLADASGEGDFSISYTNEVGGIGKKDHSDSPNNPIGYYVGLMDDFYFWNRTLNQDEIASLVGDFFLDENTNIQYEGCIGDGYSTFVNSTLYNEANPSGQEVMQNEFGCDSIIDISLIFFPNSFEELIFEDCMGSGFEVVVNSTTYNETNPSGQEVMQNQFGCDSIVLIEIIYGDHTTNSECDCEIEVIGPDYLDSDCEGSGLEVTFGSQTFNEANPSGTVTIPTISGCDSTFNVSLSFEKEVQLLLWGGDAICLGEFSTLSILTSSSDIFDIIISDSQNEELTFIGIQNGFEFDVSPSSTTSYFLTSASGSVCNATFANQIEIEVSEIEVEIIPYNNGANIDCSEEGDGILEAFVTGATGKVDYEWNQGSDTSLIENLISGDYSVTVSDELGCTDSENFQLVNGTSIELDYTLEGTSCDGSTGILTIDNIIGGSGNLYSIFLDNQPTPLSQPNFPIIFSLGPGNHIINVIDEFGCTMTEEFEVMPTDPNDDFLVISADQNIDQGSSTPLTVDGSFPIDSIIWSPENTLSCSNCTNPIAQPILTTTYYVTAFDDTGCSATAQITIMVDRETNIYIPNIFSPNDDGINDFLFVFGGVDVTQVTFFSIFDRWGNQIFIAENVPHSNEQFGWNGKFRGKKMQPDVFAYYGLIELIDGSLVEVKGDFTLIE